MDLLTILLLLGGGLVGGFLAGMTGVGGGIIYVPILLFYFQMSGVSDGIIAPLTIGSSLFCTFLASLSSTWRHSRSGNTRFRVALVAGGAAAVSVFLVTEFVTTAPWYDGRVFQIVFGIVLLVLAGRMLLEKKEKGADDERKARGPVLGGIGLGTGALSAMTGIGGGVVLMPALHRFAHLSFKQAVGTSSAGVAVISLAGVLTYVFLGLDQTTPATALGYVDFGRAALVGVPSIFSAVLGAWAATKFKTRVVRLIFASFVIVVAVRMLWTSLAA